MRARTLLLLLAVAAPGAHAQAAPSGGRPIELGVSYTAVRANFVPGLCECFWAQGGGADLTFDVRPHIALTGEIAAQHVSNTNAVHTNLGLASFLIGPRILASPQRKIQPYGQVLAGAVHGFDSEFPVNNLLAYSATGFAMTAGGGVNVRVNPHLALRLVDADYYLTRLPNAVNGTQNNLRLSAGIVFRFSSSR
jgi:outer membrane immunogenic protein